MKKRSLHLTMLIFFQINLSMGQVIDVGTPIVEEQLRRLQLMSDSAIDYSLFKRPLNIGYFDQNLIDFGFILLPKCLSLVFIIEIIMDLINSI